MPVQKQPVYKKSDYLTVIQYAKMHKENRQDVEKAMKKALYRHATIKVQNRTYEIIISDHGRLHLRPEAAAQQKFLEYLEQIKGQEK